MTVLLVLLAAMAVVLFFLEWKGGGQLDDGYNSFIMSDIGVLPGSKTYREILEASRQPREGRKMAKAPGKEVRVRAPLGSASRLPQACRS